MLYKPVLPTESTNDVIFDVILENNFIHLSLLHAGVLDAKL